MTAYATAAAGNYSATGTWNANGVPAYPLVAGDTITIQHAVTVDTSRAIGLDPITSPGTTYRILILGAGYLIIPTGVTLRIQDSVKCTAGTANARNEKFIVQGTGKCLLDPNGAVGSGTATGAVTLTIDAAASFAGITAVLRGTDATHVAVFATDRARGGVGKFNSTTNGTNTSGGYIDSEFGRIYGWNTLTTSTNASATTLAGTTAYGNSRLGPMVRIVDTWVGFDEANAAAPYYWTLSLFAARAEWSAILIRARFGNDEHPSSIGAFDAGTTVVSIAPAASAIRLIQDSWFEKYTRTWFFSYGDITGQTVFENGLETSSTYPLGSIAETVLVHHTAPGNQQFAVTSVPSGGHWAGLIVWDNPSVLPSDHHGMDVRNAIGATTQPTDTIETWTKRLALWDTSNDGGHNGLLQSAAGTTGGIRRIWVEHLLTVPFLNYNAIGSFAFEPVHGYGSSDRIRIGLRRGTFCGPGDSTVVGIAQPTAAAVALGVEDCINLDPRVGVTNAAKGMILNQSTGVGAANLEDPTRFGHNLKFNLRTGSITTVGDPGGYVSTDASAVTALSAAGMGAGDVNAASVAAIGFADFGATPATFYTDVSGGSRPTTLVQNQAAIAAWIVELKKVFTSPGTYNAAYATSAAMNYLYAAYTPSYAVAGTMGAAPGATGVTNDGLSYVGAAVPSAPAQAPTITLTPGTGVTFSATQSAPSPAAVTRAVTNTGSGTLTGLSASVSLVSGTGWLSASLDTTTAPATLTITPATGALAPGTYTATVSVASSASGVTNSPRTVAVSVTVSAPTPVVTGVTVSPSTASVVAGATQQLAATVTGTGGPSQSVTWGTSNSAVATVNSSGLVTAVAAGTATITATSVANGAFSDAASITVTASVLVPGTLTVVGTPGQTSVGLSWGAPSGGTSPYTYDVQYGVGATPGSYTTFASGQSGRTSTVTGLAMGTLYSFRVIVRDQSGQSPRSNVVQATTAPVTPAVTSVTVGPSGGTLAVGATRALVASVAVVGAATTGVTWATSNTAVATVDAAGVVTGVSPGPVTITATSTFDTNVSGNVTILVIAQSAVVLPPALRERLMHASHAAPRHRGP